MSSCDSRCYDDPLWDDHFLITMFYPPLLCRIYKMEVGLGVELLCFAAWSFLVIIMNVIWNKASNCFTIFLDVFVLVHLESIYYWTHIIRKESCRQWSDEHHSIGCFFKQKNISWRLLPVIYIDDNLRKKLMRLNCEEDNFGSWCKHVISNLQQHHLKAGTRKRKLAFMGGVDFYKRNPHLDL